MFIGVTNYEGMVCFVIVGETSEEVKKALEETSDYGDFPYNENSEILVFETRQANEVIVDDPDEPLIEPKSHCKLVERLVNDDGDLYWVPVKEAAIRTDLTVEDFTVEIPKSLV